MKKIISCLSAIFIVLSLFFLPSLPVSAQREEGTFIKENARSSFSLEIMQEGNYNIALEYICSKDRSDDPVIGLMVDGVYPYEETKEIILCRSWQDISQEKYDIQGNEIRPSQTQSFESQTTILKNRNSSADECYEFKLGAGIHVVEIATYEQSLTVCSVKAVKSDEMMNYDEVLEKHLANGAEDISLKNPIVVQAEKPSLKSSRSLLSANDRTSCNTQPYDAVKTRYNSIGGGRWSENGQWLEWKINVEKSGLYPIAVRWKQDQKNNDISSRALYIDGQLPFKEAANIEFAYSNKWQVSLLGEENQDGGYLFYLNKGEHTIRLTATVGRQQELIDEISSVISRANTAYLDIVMVTVPSPDINRDYDYEKLIPDTLKEMSSLSEKLKSIEEKVVALSGESGQNTTAIKRIYGILDKVIDDPETISNRLHDFQDSISSLASSLTDMRKQPLTLDYIAIGTDAESKPRAEGNFFAKLLHYIKQYIGSFITDYDTLGSTEVSEGKALKVWMGSDTTVIAASTGSTAGRDQLQIMRELVTDGFSANTNIPVSVQLVNAGSLLPATLAGRGPDVALGLAQSTPVNYALRNALCDLLQFDNSDDVLKDFSDAAIKPFTLDGKVYAIPETLVYPMLFYRSDILAECGVELSELDTWESLLQVALPKLQMKYLEFGVPATFNTFSTLLLQNGGKMYTDDNTASAFNSVEGMSAFKLTTSLFTQYKLDLSFNFLNRFRSGQMPLAIQDYTVYNQLSVYAPEIDGLWGMLPICGITKENGEVDRTAACTVTGCGITSCSQMKEQAWKFILWWTSEDTQTEFSQSIEALLGTAARNPTANLKARENLAWSSIIRESMRTQEKSLSCIPEIAGSYYSTRTYDFAFRDVVYEGKDIKATLNSASESIDAEIKEKRKEFYGEQAGGQN